MNKNFFSTPEALILKMIRGLKLHTFNILDPSAGDGAILDYLTGYDRERKYRYNGNRFVAKERPGWLAAKIKKGVYR